VGGGRFCAGGGAGWVWRGFLGLGLGCREFPLLSKPARSIFFFFTYWFVPPTGTLRVRGLVKTVRIIFVSTFPFFLLGRNDFFWVEERS